jgi:hypothetical protein
MKNLFTLLTVFTLSTYSFAAELNYKWKANSAYTYGATITDNISTSMMGMNVQEKYLTTVDFVLAISSVDVEGTATGTLYLVNFNVKDSKGLTVASLLNLPKNAVKSEVKVDKKGNFTFLKKLQLITTPTSNALVYANVSENGVSAGAEVDGEKVEVYAEFDPKTGKMKAGYSATTISKPKKVDVKEDEQSDEIDIIPYDLLQFLILPDGDVKMNDKIEVRAGMYTVNEVVKTLTATQAVIGQKISTDKNADMFEGSAKGESEEGSFDMGTFGGTNGMDLDTEDQAALATTNSMAPTINGELVSTFDVANGQFINSKGVITSTIDTMGVKMTCTTNFDFRKK